MHSLDQLLNGLRRRMRRNNAATGAIQWFAVTLSLVLVVCIADWWLHIDRVSFRVWLGCGRLVLA